MDASPSWPGTWNAADVTLPGGQPGYTGTLTIAKQNAVYALDWDISDGCYVGIGLVIGEHLYVACGEQYATLCLIVVNARPHVAPNVQWTTADLGGLVGSGTLVLQQGSALEGEHRLDLTLPDGRLYGAWDVHIARDEAIYRLEWRRGGVMHMRGIGLPTAHGIAAAWYPDIAQLALLEYQARSPDELWAVWALGSSNQLGTERMARIRYHA